LPLAIWAAAFGSGIRGLKGSRALDSASGYPDANVVLIAALLVYVASPFFAAVWSGWFGRRDRLFQWLLGTALAGAALFAASHLLVSYKTL